MQLFTSCKNSYFYFRQTPEPLSNNFTFNNLGNVITLVDFLFTLAFLVHFSNPRNFIPLFIGISLTYFAWEAFITSFLVITYNNGTLTVMKPKLKFSFLFRRKTSMLKITSDSFDQIWIGKPRKGPYQLLFVKDKQAVACILWEGTATFLNQLIRYYPNRILSKNKSYHQTIKNLKQDFPLGRFKTERKLCYRKTNPR